MEKIATDVVPRSCESLSQKIRAVEDENTALKVRVDDIENDSSMDNLDYSWSSHMLRPQWTHLLLNIHLCSQIMKELNAFSISTMIVWV